MDKNLSKKLNKDWSLYEKPRLRWTCVRDNIKQKKQDFAAIPERAKYCVARQDVWSLDEYIMRVIYNGLIILKEDQNGYPCGMTEEEWDAALDKNISLAALCLEDSWHTEEGLFKRYEFVKATEQDNPQAIDNAYDEWRDAMLAYETKKTEAQEELFAWLGKYLKDLWW